MRSGSVVNGFDETYERNQIQVFMRIKYYNIVLPSK